MVIYLRIDLSVSLLVLKHLDCLDKMLRHVVFPNVQIISTEIKLVIARVYLSAPILIMSPGLVSSPKEYVY